MSDKPYVIYPESSVQVEVGRLGSVINRCFINEPNQASFGVIDYVPGWYIAPHHHRTWELIVIGADSAGPGYTFFENRWWLATPGSATFFPKGYPHAWSAGNDKGFKMLWIYGGSHEEAGRIYDGNTEDFKPITREQERNAQVWTGNESHK